MESKKMPNAALNPLKFRAAVFDNMSREDKGFSNYSYWRSTIRTFFRNKAVVVLVGLVFAMIVMSILYPVFSDVDPTEVSLFPLDWNLRPSAEHWFGTDTLGRDIWARAWYGCRNSFLLGFCIALSDVGFGMIAGALWGYNKKLDPFMIELYNIMTNIPSTVYLVLLAYIMNTRRPSARRSRSSSASASRMRNPATSNTPTNSRAACASAS